jgi:RNA:NAD 2'-phosphotransferase (TPT1/KptA family)
MNHEIPNLNEQDLLGSVQRLNEYLEQLSRANYEDSVKFEKRRKPLPEKLYHITTRQNAEQIMAEGLDPTRLIFEDRDVASLSDDIEFALNVAEETQNTKRDNLVILEIDTRYLTPSRIHNYLMKADPDNPKPIEGAEVHEVHYELNIPPEAIKILKKEKN